MKNLSVNRITLHYGCIVLFILLFNKPANAQGRKVQNVFIICIDGFRWQEIFNGADSLIINDPAYVKDTALAKEQFWADSQEERKRLLMPFLWDVVAKKGQLYGNELYDNKVSAKNIFGISYPGYSEMLSGHTDRLLVPDIPINNRNSNVLEYLEEQSEYTGKVAAFTSWNIFPFIFNKKKTHFFINSGYEKMPNDGSDSTIAINSVQENVKKKNTRYDLLTFMNAKEYLSAYHPRVLFLGFGETDLFAHANRYDLYLQQANNIDKMIYELWYYVQTDPFYKNNTTFLITTDHGRGEYPSTWHDHNSFIKGSNQTWIALLGPNIPAEGEMKSKQRVYEEQIASTVMMLLGESDNAGNNMAKPILINGNSVELNQPGKVSSLTGSLFATDYSGNK